MITRNKRIKQTNKQKGEETTTTEMISLETSFFMTPENFSHGRLFNYHFHTKRQVKGLFFSKNAFVRNVHHRSLRVIFS